MSAVTPRSSRLPFRFVSVVIGCPVEDVGQVQIKALSASVGHCPPMPHARALGACGLDSRLRLTAVITHSPVLGLPLGGRSQTPEWGTSCFPDPHPCAAACSRVVLPGECCLTTPLGLQCCRKDSQGRLFSLSVFLPAASLLPPLALLCCWGLTSLSRKPQPFFKFMFIV